MHSINDNKVITISTMLIMLIVTDTMMRIAITGGIDNSNNDDDNNNTSDDNNKNSENHDENHDNNQDTTDDDDNLNDSAMAFLSKWTTLDLNKCVSSSTGSLRKQIQIEMISRHFLFVLSQQHLERLFLSISRGGLSGPPHCIYLLPHKLKSS